MAEAIKGIKTSGVSHWLSEKLKRKGEVVEPCVAHVALACLKRFSNLRLFSASAKASKNSEKRKGAAERLQLPFLIQKLIQSKRSARHARIAFGAQTPLI